MGLKSVTVLSCQLGYRDHLVTHLLKRRYYQLCRIGSSFKKIMHQNYRAVLYSLDRSLEGRLRILRLPVKCVNIPLNHRLIHTVIDDIIDTAAGRTHDRRCKADQIIEQLVILAHCRDDLISCDERQYLVLIGMRSDLHAERIFTFQFITIIIRLNT